MELQGLKYVTSGISLAAFLAAIVVALVRTIISKEATLLKSVTGTKDQIAARERLVAMTLEKFVVDTSGLSSKDKKDLALKQLEERRKRFTLVLLLVAFVAVCSTTISLIALGRP